MSDFIHQVRIDELKKKLQIDRIYPNGEKVFYTEIDLPAGSEIDDVSFKKIASMLGENLLLDSPAARRLLKL